MADFRGQSASSMDLGANQRVSFSGSALTGGVGPRRSGTLGFGGRVNILAEEKRDIDKVFQLVDIDNSGKIDMQELREMFSLFGVNDHFLSGALTRMMKAVDKDNDGQISPQEFYELLSQKFEKGDARHEIESVFNQMDKKKDKQLDVDELHDVANMLGENLSKEEIKEMILTFNTDYQAQLKEYKDKKRKAAVGADGGRGAHVEEPDKSKYLFLSMNDFYDIMQEQL